MVNPYLQIGQIAAKTTAGTYDQPYNWVATGNSTGIANWTSFKTAFSLYRLVVGGFRLKCDGSINNMTGRIYVVDVPMDTLNYANALDVMPTTIAQATSNAQLYTEYTMLELMESGIQGTLRRVSLASENFIDSGFPSLIATSGAAGNVLSSNGWCAKVILLEGLPANANCIELEYIFHIEGVGTPVNSIVPATAAAAYSPALMASAYQVAQAQPVSVRTDAGWAGNVLTQIRSGVDVAKSMWGMAKELGPFIGEIAETVGALL